MNWYKYCKLHKQAGEYWLINGQAVGADGDIGPAGHVQYVIESILADHNISMDEDDWMSMSNMELQRKGLTNKEIQCINYANGKNGYDPRKYGMEEFGWKRIWGNKIETNTLNRSDLREICNGISDIEAGDFDAEEQYEGEYRSKIHLWNIEVWNPQSYYEEVPESVICEAIDNPVLLRRYRAL